MEIQSISEEGDVVLVRHIANDAVDAFPVVGRRTMGQFSVQKQARGAALSAAQVAQRQKQAGQRPPQESPETKNHGPHPANNRREPGEPAIQLQIKGEMIEMFGVPWED